MRGALALALAAATPLAVAAGYLAAYPDAPGFVYPDAPPPGTTGGFGEPTCVSCHFATTPDTLGELVLRGLPATFERDRTYELTVELSRPDMAAAGFQLSARFAAGPDRGRQAGVFRVLGDDTAITAQSGVDYVHQTLAGAVPSTPGIARWRIEWAAPGERSARVRFHLAANAANGDESPLGDRVYALEETIGFTAPSAGPSAD
ncbi:MAG TPA: choice-of-anchor V domain-containing protein [Gemmatimonadota bacterium]|nr:choice-of-anchor V domain-containing protein [Gemmatimonadota bacterium]